MGRKRNKSSPGQKHTKSKKYKFVSQPDIEYYTVDSESEDTAYSEATSKHCSPTITTMRVSREDIEELSAKLAPSLIKDLKSALRDEVINSVKGEIKALVIQETESLREDVSQLKNEVAKLRLELKTTKAEFDELNQYGRRMCLDITGIIGDTGSPTEDVEAKILNHAKLKNIPFTSADIDKCHRKGRVRDNVINRRVIVKFTNSKARQRIYNARKLMGTGIFVQENLTPYREHLAFETRKLKREKIIANCWVAGCNIYVQQKNASTGRIMKDMEAIDAIRSAHSPVLQSD